MKLLTYVVAAAMLLSSTNSRGWELNTARASLTPATVKTVRWEGVTDLDLLRQARADLDSAVRSKRVKTLRVYLTSPGGPVITSLEIARLVRETSEKTGLVVEIHAEALCASGCTFILGSGTPGHRFMSRWALFLVHPMQQDGECVMHVDNPQTPNDKATDVLLDLMRDHYMRYTGRSAAEVELWLTCGHEQVGTGELAVRLNLADAAE